MLVLDSGGVSRLSERSQQAAALIQAFREEDLWPPLVPSIVLVECLQGHPGRDALSNSFLKTCDIVEEVSESLARRAGEKCPEPSNQNSRSRILPRPRVRIVFRIAAAH